MINVTLPWPPSTNHYWRSTWNRQTGKRQTLVSKKGREYRTLVMQKLFEQGLQKKNLRGRLTISIAAYPPDLRKRDLDNLLKATLDSLTHGNVWGDDSQIDALMIFRGVKVPGGRLSISIEENHEKPKTAGP